MNDRSVIGSLARVIGGRHVSMEVKKGLRNSILLLPLMCGSETWMWNRGQQSKVHAVETSYMRGACGVTRWDGESNESIHERCGMASHTNGINCGVMEWVKRNMLRGFGHIERMRSEELVKIVYMNEIEGPNSRGRHL